VDTRKQQLIDIVGAANVDDDEAVLTGFSRDESFAAPLRPWFVARPQNDAHVQALVKWANATRTPLVPVSSGGPHRYGDTVPSVTEAVIVDLSGMRAIKRIDRRNRIAVIEPGVTYAELAPALASQGMRIPRPLRPRANKSVVASLLERQPTTIPRLNFNLPEPLRTCGVVWGTGELAFTGEAGLGPLSLDEQWSRNFVQAFSNGPTATDLMRLVTGAQGTMGIVVWASVRLELIPSQRRFYFAPHVDLEGLVDLVYQLTRVRLGDETMILNRPKLATLLTTTADERRRLLEVLPAWSVLIGLAGTALLPEERLRVQELELTSNAQRFGLRLRSGFAGVSQIDVGRALDAFAEDRAATTAEQSRQEVFFLATLDKAAKFVALARAVAARRGYPASEIEIYIQPQHQGVSHHIEFAFPYDVGNGAAAEKIEALTRELSEELIDAGAYFSRPYGYWSDLIYPRDATSTEALRIVKGIVDPANVMNPGKLCF
jgi:FAD/FMN-containing dehydrogenase